MAPSKNGLEGRLGLLLLPWYREVRRDLPWRRNPSPYSVWVSEVMLQQTRVETVIPYYVRFLQQFPTLSDLAKASPEEVLTAWSGLGYYRRARSLHAAARLIAKDHAGEFPRELERALQVPGVGPYTAGAILSIAYNYPIPVVDGNVERVLTRLLRYGGNPKRATSARELKELVSASIPDGQASDFNQALMELGATLCTPKDPACHLCPLRGLCLARRHGDMARFPESPPARAVVPLKLNAAVVSRGGRYLLERVSRKGFLNGLWLFPFFESSRDPAASLSRRLGTKFRRKAYLGSIRHSITFRRIKVEAFLLEADSPEELEEVVSAQENFRWARLGDLAKKLPVSSMALKIARKLRG